MTPQQQSHQTVVAETHPSRRAFLTHMSRLTGGFLAFGWPFMTGHSRSAYAHDPQPLMKSNDRVKFLLEMNGKIAGPLQAIGGGGTSYELQTFKTPGLLVQRLGKPHQEDLVVSCGTNLSKEVYQWLAEAMNTQRSRRNGAILVADKNAHVIERREFYNAVLKKVVFPALDTTSQDPGYLTVTLAPDRIASRPPQSRNPVPDTRVRPSGWSPSKFRLRIQGLEQACVSVRSIEPLVLNQEIITQKINDKTGNQTFSLVPGRKNTGDLVITLPPPSAEPFTQWFSAFVRQGQNPGQTKDGTLEFLAPNGQSVLASVTLNKLGIFGMAPVIQGGSYQVQIKMFCESLQLTRFPGGSYKAPSTPQQPTRRPAQKRNRKRRRLSPIQK